MGQRLFFALDIDETARGKIVAAADKLRSTPGRISWTKARNLHVTMNFLGDVPDKRVDELCDLARETVTAWSGGRGEVAFSLGPLICFPPNKPLRMIWAPVSQGADLLASMHEAMNQALQTGGWRNEDRPFTGHVTVARIKTAELSDVLARLPDDQPGAITAKELTLYQSQLTRTGPIYRRLMGFPFEHKP